jgi:hypothetical protein
VLKLKIHERVEALSPESVSYWRNHATIARLSGRQGFAAACDALAEQLLAEAEEVRQRHRLP